MRSALQPLAIKLALLRERLVLLRLSLLRLSLQYHALTHFLSDLMILLWIPRRLRMLLLTSSMRFIRTIAPGMSDLSPAVELALEIIDLRLQLGDFDD